MCTFVNEALLYKIRTDLSVSNAENETLTIEIINKNAKNIIVSNCYRPPAGKVSSITDKLIRENKNCLLLAILILIAWIIQLIQKLKTL